MKKSKKTEVLDFKQIKKEKKEGIDNLFKNNLLAGILSAKEIKELKKDLKLTKKAIDQWPDKLEITFK